MANFPIDMPLEDPFEFGSERVVKITIARKPTVRDIRGIGNLSPTDQSIKILEKVAGITPAMVDRISLTDFGRISERVASFL